MPPLWKIVPSQKKEESRRSEGFTVLVGCFNSSFSKMVGVFVKALVSYHQLLAFSNCERTVCCSTKQFVVVAIVFSGVSVLQPLFSYYLLTIKANNFFSDTCISKSTGLQQEYQTLWQCWPFCSYPSTSPILHPHIYLQALN